MNSLKIVDLPLEMLVEIFQHLKPCDRREVQLVCHTFFDACQHPRFQIRGDHHLHFNYCELAANVPPVSVFLRATRNFNALTLSNFDCDKPIDDFWRKMGRTVEYLEFNGFCDFGIYLPQVLNRFTTLKTLKLDADFVFGRHFPCVMPRVERLQLTFNVHGSGEHEESDIADLIAAMPKLRHIELLVYTGSFEALLPFILKYQTKIRGITFQMLPDDTPALVNILKCIIRIKKIKLEKLCITYFNNWLLLDELIEKQDSLRLVEIGTNTFPQKTFHNIKKIEISINDRIQSFESLKFLPNLEILIVLGSYGQTNCFFGHTVITNKNVHELQLHDLKFRLCSQCFDAMAQSFPNMTTFYSTGNHLENEHLKILQSRLSYLKDIRILDHTQVTEEFITRCPGYSSWDLLECLDISGAFRIQNSSLLDWPYLPNLRVIGFGKIFDVNMVGMKNFLLRCPSVESFNIHETIRLTDEILRLIFTTLQRLKHFRIYNEFEEDSLRRRDRPWLDITNGCRELQSLRIIDERNNVDIKYHLFKRIRSLKVILHANHDIMTRASCFSINNYVKAIGIPYSKLGKLQDIVEKYSDDEFDYGYVAL